MEREDLGDGRESPAEPQSAGGWGCTVSGVAGLLGIIVALRWSAAVGIPLFVIAALLGWRSAKRSVAITEARTARRLAAHGSLVGDVWRRLFAAEGLGDIVDRLAPHIRAAVRISTSRVDALAPGASRIGGVPDLAAGMVWPRHDGLPIAFLAQFDLQEVAQVEPRSPLPRTGHLWFFYDVKGFPGGASPSNGGGAIVLYDGSGAALVRTEPPPDLSEKSRFSSCAVTLEAYEDIPDPANERWLDELLGQDEARAEMYGEIQSELESGLQRNPHKLLGYAGPIQDVMELDCQLEANGIPFAKRKKEAVRVEALKAGARDWRLLFQVESDGNAKMMWGDAGRIYYWIKHSDLVARDWASSWLILQCC